MNSEKLTKLEAFVERHRPDFDAHEPSPDLWARLEQELAAPGPGVGPVLLTEPAPLAAPAAAPAQQPAAPRLAWLSRYGVAAALAALVFAAGLSEARRAHSPAEEVASVTTPAGGLAADNPPSTYVGPPARALAAYEHDDSPGDPRLSAAVRGMESYYAAQLTERQAELRQLDAQNPAADWPRELASLDSSYRVLKAELPHHPQPQTVLTAMNRNLQIRLDILDQQLSHRAPGSPVATRDEYGPAVLADSRR